VTTTCADGPESLAQVALLIGLLRGDSLPDIESAVRQTQTRSFTPDLAVLDVAVAAMELAGVDRRAPLTRGDLAEHLPEGHGRNRRALQERTTYALNVVAALRGGLVPDVLEDTYWWGTRDIVEYSVIAATAYVQACAQRRGQPLAQFIGELQEMLTAGE
jgi:hypothetical protein